MNDMPAMCSSTYGTATSAVNAVWLGDPLQNDLDDYREAAADQVAKNRMIGNALQFLQSTPVTQQTTERPSIMPKRIVRVYLVDPDERVPVSDSILYNGTEKPTDLTDTELYFEIPVNELLTKHNIKRRAIVDKKATEKVGKDVFLDEIKIRDLKMQVVVVAQF